MSVTLESLKNFLKLNCWDDILELSNIYPDSHTLVIDFKKLLISKFDRDLISNPKNFFKLLTQALKELDLPTDKQLLDARIEISNMHHTIPPLSLSDISKHQIGKFIAIEGMVKQISETTPKITIAAMECLRCGTLNLVEQHDLDFVEPIAGCENELCGKKEPFKLDLDKSEFTDFQLASIQELPYHLKTEKPHSLKIQIIGDDITGVLLPGERVIVSGTLLSRQQTGKQGKKLTTFEYYMDLNNVEHLDENYADIQITPSDEENIRKLGASNDIYTQLTNSISPSIYGYEDIKFALALQMFSGSDKLLKDNAHLRGDIHILLIGDPGVAKSQLLRYIARVTPHGISASGKGSSGVGLTAAVVPDTLNNGGWTFEAGALVKANFGTCCIDEMDKMREDDTSALHEAMEQQTITLFKAGLNPTFKAECCVLGAANPKYGRFDPSEPLADQVEMPAPLLSRFDLIFLLRDIPDPIRDAKIAKHILDSHESGARRKLLSKGLSVPEHAVQVQEIEPAIETDLLRKYIAYTKKNYTPVFESEEVENQLIKFYTSVRTSGNNSHAPIPLTARSLESLRRLCEASARMRLSPTISVDDVKRVIAIVVTSLKQVGLDPETGRMDVDIIECGQSKSQAEKIKSVRKFLANNGTVTLEEVSSNFKFPVEPLLQKLHSRGDIFCPNKGEYRLVK